MSHRLKKYFYNKIDAPWQLQSKRNNYSYNNSSELNFLFALENIYNM